VVIFNFFVFHLFLHLSKVLRRPSFYSDNTGITVAIEHSSNPWAEGGDLIIEGSCSFSLAASYGVQEASIRVVLNYDIEDIVVSKHELNTK